MGVLRTIVSYASTIALSFSAGLAVNVLTNSEGASWFAAAIAAFLGLICIRPADD